MIRVSVVFSVMVIPVLAEDSVQRITFTTADGVQIVADYYAPRTTVESGVPVVIMLHQYPSTRSSWRPLAARFHEAGYAVLAPDLRGHGESVEPKSMGLERGRTTRDPRHYRAAWQDVLAAYDWLKGRKEVDRSRFALIGSSIGSSIALDYAARDRSVDVVVCLSPGPNYMGVDSRRDIVNVGKRPILLVAPGNEREQCEALGRLAAGATVKIIEGSDLHGTFMFGKVPGIEQLIFDFVKSHIGRPTTDHVVASIKTRGKGKYHKPTCVYASPDEKNRMAISEGNLRVFSSPAEGEARGYAPCQRCFGTKSDQ
jgi:pimeloyl-ACP methyl ester carboxylesterase